MNVFFIVVGVIWGIISIILFFKIWDMTNNVERIVEFLYSEKNSENSSSDSRFLELMGDKEYLKEKYLMEFSKKVEKSAAVISYNDRKADVNQMSIAGYVEQLKRQFAEINEEVPASIAHMKTFGDYFEVVGNKG